jgi:rhodanese-related sulfurtransferase
MGWFSRVPAVNAAEARALVDAGAVLLDVREKAEWDAGHAPAAVHVPLARLAQAGPRVSGADKVVVVCRSGNRSAHATKALRETGVDAVNLSGGMNAWAAIGGPVRTKSGRPGTVV